MRQRLVAAAALGSVWLIACGGSAYSYESGGAPASSPPASGSGEATASAATEDNEWQPPSLAGGAAAGDDDGAAARADRPARLQADAAPAVAREEAVAVADAAGPGGVSFSGGLLQGAMTTPQGTQTGGGGGQPQKQPAQPPQQQPPEEPERPERPAEEKPDGERPGPLLIYTANFHMAVFQVEKTRQSIVEVAEELDGYVSEQSEKRVVIRVPAEQFERAVDAVTKLGDVLNRNIKAADVSEQYRDVSIRLRNAEAMRVRLEKLLERADSVEEALKIEKEMQRLTEIIETLKGRLRYLQDRIAFSTVTVTFQPRPTEQIEHPDVFRLPFDWLGRLGLSNLLRLR